MYTASATNLKLIIYYTKPHGHGALCLSTPKHNGKFDTDINVKVYLLKQNKEYTLYTSVITYSLIHRLRFSISFLLEIRRDILNCW